MKLEEKLVLLRKGKRLSQLKLAEMMNVSRQAISRWEVGAGTPSTENLKYLGSLYGVPLEYLLNDDAPEPVREDQQVKENVQRRKAYIKRRSVTLTLAVIGLVSMILCTILLMDRGEGPKKMDNMEGMVVETENTDDFDLEF